MRNHTEGPVLEPADRPYPPPVGHKFNEDGSVRIHPGNTVVCHLSPETALYRGLSDLKAELDREPFASFYTTLPAESYHMTMFCGVLNELRNPRRWPLDLPADAPLEDCTAHFTQALSQMDPVARPPFRMRLTRLFYEENQAIRFDLEPVDAAENLRVRALRDQFARTLHLDQLHHDEYVFHVTVGYVVNWVTPEQETLLRGLLNRYETRLIQEQGVVEFGAPEFCVFQSMFRFDTQFYVGEPDA